MTEIESLKARVAALEQTVQALLAKAPRTKPTKAEVDWNRLLDDGMSGDVATDFLAHRKQLKAPLTPTAWAGIQREARKAGISLDAAATMMCVRGWRGFDASWVKPEQRTVDMQAGDSAFLRRLGR